MPDIVRHLAETVGPIVTASRENFYRLVDEVNLDAIAVEFDSWIPSPAAWDLVDRRCQRRLNEAGKFALTP
jgi:hypothetical protein